MFEALRAAAEVCLGRSDLEGLRVAVQGLGNVGMPFCGYLSAAGAALVVSDLDANRCAQAAATYGATVAAPEKISPDPVLRLPSTEGTFNLWHRLALAHQDG